MYPRAEGFVSASSNCLRSAAICFLTISSNVGFGTLSSVAIRTRAETLGWNEISASRNYDANVQCFLQVCETEIICKVCYLILESVGKQDVFVVSEFLLPILNVQIPLIMGRFVKQAVVELASVRVESIEKKRTIYGQTCWGVW